MMKGFTKINAIQAANRLKLQEIDTTCYSESNGSVMLNGSIQTT